MIIEVNPTIYAASEESLRIAFHAVMAAEWMLGASKKSFHILSYAYSAELNAKIVAELNLLEDAMSITGEQITALEAEAGEHGDQEMVAICLRALDGDDDARAICAGVIQDAAAMSE